MDNGRCNRGLIRVGRGAVAALALAACSDANPVEPVPESALSAVRQEFPGENPGPPLYSTIEALFHPTDGTWIAVAWLRSPGCVRPDFNLFALFDVPAAFGCALEVEGSATFVNDPPALGEQPIKVQMRGLGAVPIWFVLWDEYESAIADGVLLIGELAGLPSLVMGTADSFKMTQHPGANRPQGAGNGKIEISSRGTLVDGRGFQFHVREMGIDGETVNRSVKIAFD